MSTLPKQFISTLGKVVASIGLLSLFSVMPLKAQVLGNGVKFTTTFPFYVGKAEMPAGTYMITQLGISGSDIVGFRKVAVGSHDPLHSAMILVMPTESSNPPRQSLVFFEKYGDTLHFDRVSLEGFTSGVEAIPTKTEKQAEKYASVVEERSIAAYGE
jgi:hypothetical protein